jgi:hypothetical protein
MLTIGGAAGAASFTHVHNVAAVHGQPGWLAWADAIVLELMSIASGLELRRRKRGHVSVRFPSIVLGCAVTLSLAAQVVEAEPSPIGWIAAAVPALGFLVMVKVALGSTTTTPSADTIGAVPQPPDRESKTAPSASWAEPTVERTSVQRGPTGRGPSADELLAAAQHIRAQLDAQRQPVTREALARGLRRSGHTVSNTRVSDLLKALKAQPSLPTDDRPLKDPLITPDSRPSAQPSGDARS